MTDQPSSVSEADFAGLYGELRRMAERFLSRERKDHTLQPTALVHEVYLRISRDRRFGDLEQREILAASARSMRDVLVEHARRKRAAKRGGGAQRVPLDESLAAYESRALDLLALEDALQRLGELDAQLVRVVELRFFGGLTEEETAQVLEVSPRTVRRAWSVARMWLARELGKGNDEQGPLAANPEHR